METYWDIVIVIGSHGIYDIIPWLLWYNYMVFDENNHVVINEPITYSGITPIRICPEFETYIE